MACSKMDRKLKKVFFDLESNGFCYIRKYSFRHNIIQIGAVDEYGNEFNKLVKPNHPINELSTKCHGLTDSDINDASDLSSVWNNFLLKCVFLNIDGELDFEQDVVFIAHNCYGFDMCLLIYDLNRHGITLPSNIHFFDTLVWFKNNLQLEYTVNNPTPYSLSSLYFREFDSNFKNAHNAFADVTALFELFKRSNIEVTFENVVTGGMDGMISFQRKTLLNIINLKGIGVWRNSCLVKRINEKAEYIYKYDNECTIEEAKKYLFDKLSVNEAVSLMRNVLKMHKDDYIAEIISIIYDIDLKQSLDVIRDEKQLLAFNLNKEQIFRLKECNVLTVNELIELEHFPENHDESLKQIFQLLNKNTLYSKIKSKM